LRGEETVTARATVNTWLSRLGLIEEFEYPAGPAEVGEPHAHRHLQICLSLDFPGRYTYRGRQHDVPVGAVSTLDAWEPHFPADPCDRWKPSHYIVMYLEPSEIRTSVDLDAATSLPFVVGTEPSRVRRFRRLYRALRSGTPLEQDERYREMASVTFGGPAASLPPRPAPGALRRARDYIAAYAPKRCDLQEIARVADLTPWHFARAFREQFGVPPHRFQTWMRIDSARRLLAEGRSGAEVAHLTGFADQSHFVRTFKRITGMTPRQWQPRGRC
jgi:AraC-like DNA-binding protein